MRLLHYFEKEITALLLFSAPIPSHLGVQLGFIFIFFKRVHLTTSFSKTAQDFIFVCDRDVL